MALNLVNVALLLVLLVLDSDSLLLISDVKLSQSKSGVVQVTRNGELGTICQDHFTHNDAKVVCREAGFEQTGIAIAVREEVFGAGQGEIHFDELRCDGSEQSLTGCNHNLYGDCVHSEDAGVICDSSSVQLRLSNGDYGRLEVVINGKYGTVCDDHFSDKAARVVCHQLGYSTTDAHWGKTHNVAGYDVPIYLDDVICDGTEDNILKCKMGVIGWNDCFHDEDVNVYCNGKVQANLQGPTPLSATTPPTTRTTTTPTSATTTQACADDSRVQCTPSVCSGPLNVYCPVTCHKCIQSTTLPCKDSTIVNCKDHTVCTKSALKTFCPATCGLCNGAKPTSWIPIPAGPGGK